MSVTTRILTACLAATLLSTGALAPDARADDPSAGQAQVVEEGRLPALDSDDAQAIRAHAARALAAQSAELTPRTPGSAARRSGGICSPHSAQLSRLSPAGSRLRARSMTPRAARGRLQQTARPR